MNIFDFTSLGLVSSVECAEYFRNLKGDHRKFKKRCSVSNTCALSHCSKLCFNFWNSDK